MADIDFLSPREAAKLTGEGHATMHRRCQQHAGFALLIADRWRIPREHINRMMAGEPLEQISRNPSVSHSDWATGAAASLEEPAPLAQEGPDLFSDEPDTTVAPEMADAVAPDTNQDELRHRLLRSYFFALGLRHHDAELSDAKHQSLAWSVSEDLLATIRALGVMPSGGLKDAIRDTGVLHEYRALTGIEAEI